MVLYHGIGRPPKTIFSHPIYCESSRRETCVFLGKTQLVPAGYVVTKNGLGGVGVGTQQNRNSHMMLLHMIWYDVIAYHSL